MLLGRTNATKLYHKTKPNEAIRYVDICSLYPYVNKYGRYPIGHPIIFSENFAKVDIDHQPYEGLMKIDILPPRQMYHPVLPYRSNGKLLFPLCRTCAESQLKGKCQHTDAERTLHGTWVTLEIYKALELGYKIVKIYYVWHYEQSTQYNKEVNPDGGLFTDYVNTFMKIKLVSIFYISILLQPFRKVLLYCTIS